MVKVIKLLLLYFLLVVWRTKFLKNAKNDRELFKHSPTIFRGRYSYYTTNGLEDFLVSSSAKAADSLHVRLSITR